MTRKLLGTLTLMAVLFLASPSWAGATTTPYPAPPVPTTTHVTAVSSTPSLLTTVPGQATPLASTGSGINVGLTLTIGAVVVLLGIALVIIGGRRAFGRSRHS